MGMENHRQLETAAASAAIEFDQAVAETSHPLVLAIIRYAHDVIRGALCDLNRAIFEREDYNEAKGIWEHIGRWIDIHGRMEDGVKDLHDGRKVPIGFFRYLDMKANGVCSKSHMHEEHTAIHTLENAVEEAFESWDLSVVKVVYPAFEKGMLSHLNREDELMLPAIMKLTKEGGPAVYKYMQQDFIPALMDGGKQDLEFFIKYANEVMERNHDGTPRNRAFCHALWGVATEAQWKEWSAWIQKVVPAQTYQEIEEAICKSQAAGYSPTD